MEIEKLAVSTFRVRSEKGKQFLIDPWISGNPTAIPELKSAAYLKQFDAVLVSHGHLDHADGVPDFHKANPDAPIICNNELGHVFIREGITNVTRLDCGGSCTIDNVTIAMVSATHSSSYGKNRVFAGPAHGIIIILENKYTIYYAADTGLMADMKYVIGDYYKPDLAILPVAGVFMMDIDQAVYAAGELIKPKKAIPFGYFPDPEKAIDPAGMAAFLKAMTSIAPMTGDFAPAFRKALAKSYPEIDAVILEVGQKIDLR